MEQIGKVLVTIGLALTLIGALTWLGAFKWLRLGRLPGDIAIERDGINIYFPITSMLLISAVLSLILYLVGTLRK